MDSRGGWLGRKWVMGRGLEGKGERELLQSFINKIYVLLDWSGML